MVTSEIYTYKDMYEEAGNDLTCANFAHVISRSSSPSL